MTTSSEEPKNRPIIVCVDDDPDILASVARTLRRDQLDVRSTLDCEEALEWLSQIPAAVLISDYEMPQMTGGQLTGRAKRIRPETVRILLTGKRTLETALDGINQGEIFKFIPKPFDNDGLRRDVAAAIERNKELLALAGDRQRRQRGERLRQELETEYPGITRYERPPGGHHEISPDPQADAAELGLDALFNPTGS
jgi:DNA-binding NtrC family response regulator